MGAKEDISRIRGNYGEEKFLSLLNEPSQDKINDLEFVTGLYFEMIEEGMGYKIFALNLNYYFINACPDVVHPFNFREVSKVRKLENKIRIERS